MLKLDEQIHIRNLLTAGNSVPYIAKRVGCSTATIYKYKNRNNVLLQKPNVPSVLTSTPISSKLNPFLDYIQARMRNGFYNSSKLYKELQLHGYAGSYHHVNVYVKNNRVKSLDNYKPAQQLLTSPGEQAQVDWGSFGRVEINAREEKLYAFVYVLSYCRAMYVEFVVRQNQKTLQQCHIHAFEALGIPKSIVYDNMKTVVLSHPKKNQEGKVRFNPAFIDFARYYNFEPDACYPYWPRSKGKVEAMVKYVRNNFMHKMLPRKEFISLEDLNLQVRQWVKDVANQRIHNTTKEKPKEMWLMEKNFLQFSNIPAYNASMLNARYSTKDGHVNYKSCLYSIPCEYALKKLYIRDISVHGLPIVEIYYQDKLIATHQMSFQRGKWVTKDEHLIKQSRRGTTSSVRSQKRPIAFQRPHVNVEVRDLSFYNLLLKQKYGTQKS